MDLFICTVLQVVESCFLPLFNGLIQQLNVEKQLLIVLLLPRHPGNVAYTGSEVAAGESFQLFHQFPALAVGQMAGEEKAVDQEPQLPFGKGAHQIEIRKDGVFLFLAGASSGDLTVFNVKTKFHQIHQIPFDGLAVGGHTVPGPQDLADFPLGKAVILVGILPENIQNIENQQLFGLLRIHLYSPLPFCMIACRLPGDKRFRLITENRFQETKPMTRRSGFRI